MSTSHGITAPPSPSAAGPAPAQELRPPARLETDDLYEIIGVVASSPDLDGVLDGVVGLITEATNCHACFVYLREGETMRMRAASQIYAHLVGRVELGIEEGLTGWVARTRTSAFIRDNALRDPRFKLVSGIPQERFQSLIAVPIPARAGDALGVIMLHSEASHEFDHEVLVFLEHTASLVAGAIENARLFEQAQRRVDALTALTALGQRIASVTERDELYRAVTEGVRSLLACDVCALHVLGRLEGQLTLAATDPPTYEVPWANVRDTSLLLGTLRSQQRARSADAGPRRTMLVATIAAGADDLGVLVVAGERGFDADEDELLRTVASQVAVALKRSELIERLTTENLTREVFNALATDDHDLAHARARAAGFDLDNPHVIVDARPRRDDARPWPALGKRLAARLRRVAPGSSYELEPQRLRALVPVRGDGCQTLHGELDALAREERLLLGSSDLRHGADGGRAALRQAEDAVLIARALRERGGALSYEELGAYKYLVRLTDGDTPRDRHLQAVERVADYDRRRRAELLKTLGEYLRSGRSPVATARALHIHPNTLRQRLDRIEKLAELPLADQDMLSLELAVKLHALRAPAEQNPQR